MAGEQEQNPLDDQLQALLLAFEAALLKDPAARPPELPTDFPANLVEQWQRGCEVIRKLHHLSRSETAEERGTAPREPFSESEPPAGASDKSVLRDETSASAGEPQAPLCIGRFLIRHTIANNANSVVYQAFDPAVNRIVALKVPRMDLDASARARFLQEAEAAGRLSHPGIAAVYEAGEEGHHLYVASEYCDGPTLATWLTTSLHPVPIRQCVELLQAIGNAVQHAHGRGVLHRDIKPTNVLMVSAENAGLSRRKQGRNEFLVPKLCDFGMAKLLEDRGHSTQHGVILGTPEYMSPEQAQGRIDDIDVTTDVYGLGALLYRVLTGEPPFHGKTLVATLHRVVYEEPCRLRRLRSDIPRDLEAICLKCLAKLPEERYSTVQEFLADLHCFANGLATKARPLRPWQRVTKWARRRPGTALLAGTVSVLTSLLVLVVLFYNVRLSEAIRRESDARSRLQEQVEIVQHDVWAADLAKAWLGVERERGSGVREYFSKHGLQLQSPHSFFAARLLERLFDFGQDIRIQHDGPAYAAEFSPHGDLIASAGADGRIFLYHRSDGTLQTLPDSGLAHNDEINCLRFSPDGSFLISGSDDGLVKIWSMTRADVVAEIPCGRVSEIAVSGNGVLMAITSVTGELTLLRGADYEHLQPSPIKHSLSVDTAALSSDGALLAAACRDRRLRLFTTCDGELVHTSELGPNAICSALAFAHRGHLLLTADRQSWDMRFWNPDSEKSLEAVRFGRSWIHSVAFSADDRWMAFSNKDGAVGLYDMLRGKIRATLFTNARCVRSVRFAPAGDQLLIAGDDGTVRLIDIEQLLACQTERSFDTPLAAVALLADRKSIAIHHKGGALELWDNHLERPLRDALPTQPVKDKEALLAFHRSSSLSVYAMPGALRIAREDLSTGHRLQTFEGLSSPVISLAISENGQRLATAHANSELRVWEADRGVATTSVTTTQRDIISLAFADAGRRIVTLGGYRLRCWDSTTLARQLDPLELRRETCGVVAHPTEPLVATSDGDEILLWNLRTNEISRLPAHNASISALAFSPDGSLLASGGHDGALRLWDTGCRRSLATLYPGLARLVGLAFSVDGDALAAISESDNGLTHVTTWQVRSPAADSWTLTDFLHKPCPAGAGAARVPTLATATDSSLRYANDFDNPATLPELVVATCVGGTNEPAGRFAGPGREGRKCSGLLRRASGTETVRLEFSNLPAHRAIDINFLLAVIDAWSGVWNADEGPHLFEVRVDGQAVFRESFSNRPGGEGQFYVPSAEVCLARADNLGFEEHPDSLYDMRCERAFENLVHSGPTLVVEWQARHPKTHQPAQTSWALDNLEIVLRR